MTNPNYSQMKPSEQKKKRFSFRGFTKFLESCGIESLTKSAIGFIIGIT